MAKVTQEELDRRFSHHPPIKADETPDEDRIANHTGARIRCLGLAEWIAFHVPDGREQSLALTKLEEVMFWCNAGIAREGR